MVKRPQPVGGRGIVIVAGDGKVETMSEERRILVASESGIWIRSVKDILDAIGACFGADGLLLTEDDLAPEFFDLKSGFAGELLQKFVNYGVRVAIILPNPTAYGQRFRTCL